MKIQYWKNKTMFRDGKSKDQWFFRIRAKNGKIIAQSEGYKKKASCIKTIYLFLPITTNIKEVKR